MKTASITRTALAAVAVLGLCGYAFAGQTIYVDDNAVGSNDGSSWDDAYNCLQDALADAGDGDEIRVAQGIYKPDRSAVDPNGSGDRTATFKLINGVTIKGGYADFGEPDPNARDIQAHETILSGDLRGDDIQVKDPLGLLYEPTRTDNSYHVITSSGTGVLDGFIITAGNSSWTGGGMINSSGGSPTLINCMFRVNSARSNGGGMYNEEGSPTLINCIFSGNSARGAGGMWCGDSGKPKLINCTFSGNSASSYCGGMGNNESDPTLTNCILWGNSDSTGEELRAQISGGYWVINYSCIQGLIGNFGGTGNIGDDPLFIEADGADNIPGTADDNLRLLPGSPCIDAGDNSIIPPSVFNDLDGDPRIIDMIVDMGAYEGPHQGFLLSSESITVPEGQTSTFTVALAMDPLGTVEVTVVAESGDPDITVVSGAMLTFDSSDYSTPQNVTLAADEDKDNLNSLALFKVSGPQLLAAGIRAIEQDNDLPAGNILFVDSDAQGLNTGMNWSEAYTELQDALGIAAANPQVKEIRVAEGIYKPDRGAGITPGDRTATFQLINGLTIKGGYAGFGEPEPNDRDIAKYETILSGDLHGDDIEIVYPESLLYEPTRADNSYHVLSGSETDATSVLDGFTVVAGNANGFREVGYDNGGGMYNYFGSPTVMNCIFKCNSAKDGGGMCNRTRWQSDSSPTLTNLMFIANAADEGAGVNNKYSSPILSRCTFRDNWALDSGGGMSSMDSLTTLTDCIFYKNHAKGYGGGGMGGDARAITKCIFIENSSNWFGGGIYCSESSPRIANCIFIGNSAGQSGGGVQTKDGNPMLINCTLNGNSAGKEGGGLFSKYSDPELTNCILWGNCPQQIGEEGYPVSVIYSDVQGGWSGEGNIDVDPCFVEPGYWDPNGTPEDANDDFWFNGDYHLLAGSLCIDAGDPNYVAEPNETDLDGNPRVIGGRIDMGAYEFWGPIYSDDDAQNDPGPGDPQVSDPLENGTEDHPFDTIQEGINVAKDGYTVLVRQGSYFEPASGGSIDFLGKNITLRSEDPTDWDIVNNTIIRRYVQFSGTEGPSCKFAGFKISNLEGAIYGNHTYATISHCNISGNGPCGATVIQDCDGTISNCLITDNTTFFYCGIYPVVFECNGLIKNCTIANNESGISVGSATIKNCIIYNNEGPQVAVTNGNTVNISYSNVQDGLEGVVGDGHVNWGPGNTDTDPCFVRLGYWMADEMTLNEGDYHLRSEGWRWNTEDGSWTYNYTTSRCIDAGNPGSPLLGELMSVPRDPNNMWGINLRINMGAFGGTSQASMPPYDWALLTDLNNDGTVNFIDFACQAKDWLATAPEQPGDLNRDGVLNRMDLRALAEEWLQTTIWIE